MNTTGFASTDEQHAIIARAHRASSYAVVARAGTGKTTTATAITQDQPNTRFLYLAFSKRGVEDVKDRFGSNTTVKTAHSLAYAVTGKHYRDRFTTSGPNMKNALAPRFESAYSSAGGDPSLLEMSFFAVLNAIEAFCASADPVITETHFDEGPYDMRIAVKLARGMWRKMEDRTDNVPISHDAYLKMWQLTGACRISASRIIFDESQDASRAMIDIVEQSQVPTIYIGDPQQSIYGFRGAVDAFDVIPDLEKFPLTTSWRFGARIAGPANDVLAALGERFLIDARGSDGQIVFQNDSPERAEAIIARSNAGLVTEAVDCVDDGARIHIVGGHEQIFSWLRAAWDLRANGRSRHSAFAMFPSYSMLLDSAATPIGRAYKPYVDLVERFRSETPDILDRLERACVPSGSEDVVLSSAHRFKGQEADNVRIADDFQEFCTIDTPETKNADPTFTIDRQEAHLAYVALTRARKILDLSNYYSVLARSLINIERMQQSEIPLSRVA